ncbi:MAG: hypothetical protein H6607_10730 [Flavobacteriales bacterium]|nr:hypothetical protein [Flavobacteriales bacterium]
MKAIRILTVIIQLGLLIAGLTGFFVPQGMDLLTNSFFIKIPVLADWLPFVKQGVSVVDNQYPFIWYGTDWMVFAHILLAILYIGLYNDPIKNEWLATFGLISSAAVFPLAFIMGSVRHIPFVWQLFDCSFGLIAGILFVFIKLNTNKLKNANNN